jgi:DNA modification methylase
MSQEDYFKFTSDWIKESSRIIKDNGSIFISATYHNLGEVLINLKLN